MNDRTLLTVGGCLVGIVLTLTLGISALFFFENQKPAAVTRNAGAIAVDVKQKKQGLIPFVDLNKQNEESSSIAFREFGPTRGYEYGGGLDLRAVRLTQLNEKSRYYVSFVVYEEVPGRRANRIVEEIDSSVIKEFLETWNKNKADILKASASARSKIVKGVASIHFRYELSKNIGACFGAFGKDEWCINNEYPVKGLVDNLTQVLNDIDELKATPPQIHW